MNTFNRLTSYASIAGGLVSVFFILYSSSTQTEDTPWLMYVFMVLFFTAYLLSPFALLLVLNNKKDVKDSKAQSLGLLVAAVGCTGAASYLYTEATFFGTSSTSSLIFAVLPFYMLLFIVTVSFISPWLEKRKPH